MTESVDVTVAVAAYLVTLPAVESQVAGRVGAVLDAEFPAIRINEVATGESDEVDGWARTLLQLDCAHATREGAADLSRAVAAGLRAAGNVTVAGAVLGRAETVRRYPNHDETFDPPQPLWSVTGYLFTRPA